ncbi:pentapeptide repeat-containing protein [Helicobacter canadensis]|uniref:Pentapeptide repeat-containing protein n=1 Tax=Helicobacter canadensis MIT 98-5491 TaxID=537970 RepID=C5ZWY4_9HELI|nr:pentapeptide repeat-containing protein [Helicobacter canadensis]EES89652.1 conserved hypothetical protein [Helicobacter canadensis MIT 98-5491]EFR48443.1 hypothetical protein HCMG_00616 [Helicobacter canadensis MIT 98-5491]STO99688.1 membrane protein [Helicobacter canadensis]
MKHLTKEQEQEIWDKVSKEVENFDTFLDKSQCIDEICRKIKSISEGMVQLSWTTLDETLKRTKEITYECIGTKEIQDVFGKDFSIQYSSDTFCIMPKPKIQPYNENQQDSKDLQEQDIKNISCFKLPILLEKYPLLFMNCVFHCEFLNTDFTKDLKKLCFMQCEFKEKITLNFKECLDVFLMSYCTFEKPLTIHGKFKENADFNNSTFKDSADFSKCEFEKTACFYGVKFDKAFNFSQAQFKGSLNAVNANLNFGFESLKEKIKQEHTEYNKRESIKKPLAHFANDFRDSFRIFKSTLIKDNNLLDASEFHKCELYCKELELKESRHKRGINANNNEDARKNIKPFKELIDFLLLRFYRNLCDHHTDFLKCFNNLVLLVALYAVLLWIGNFDLMQGKEPIISDILHQLGDKAITLKKDIKKYDWLVFLIFLALAVSCLYYLYKTIYLERKLYIKNIKLILSFTKNSLKNICFFMLISVAIIFFYAAIIATLITLLNLNDMHYWQSYLNFINFVLFFVIYFSLISLDCVFVRFLLVIAAYIITSISIGKNIAILNPLIGKLLNTSIEIKDPIFQSITIAYTISTLLVLFSLQKTARKNSIVPN